MKIPQIILNSETEVIVTPVSGALKFSVGDFQFSIGSAEVPDFMRVEFSGENWVVSFDDREFTYGRHDGGWKRIAFKSWK